MASFPKANDGAENYLLSQDLSEAIGVNIVAESVVYGGGNFTGIRYQDLPKPNGVTFVLSDSPRRITCELVLDPYAGGLLQEFAATDSEDRALFQVIRRALEADGASVKLFINDVEVRSEVDADFPSSPWQRMEFEASKPIVGSATSRLADRFTLARDVCLLFLNMMATSEDDLEMSEKSQFADLLVDSLGEVEGRRMTQTITRYERSRKNRAACIRHFGVRCQVCHIDFGEKYGILGRGYIEVHHRLPVSLMQKAYRLDVLRDLIPVCSNCHRMMHRQWPPVTPEDLSKIINGDA